MDDISIGFMTIVSTVVVIIVIVLIIQYLKPESKGVTKPKKDLHVYTYTPESKTATKPKKDFNVSMCIPESKRVTKPIDQKEYYTDHETINLAHEMKGVTLLRTNEGNISMSTLTRHAEIIFI